MATITIKVDPKGYWNEFLDLYNIRHERIHNDETKFILYYESDFHLLKLGYEFGMYAQKQLMYEAIKVTQRSERTI